MGPNTCICRVTEHYSILVVAYADAGDQVPTLYLSAAGDRKSSEGVTSCAVIAASIFIASIAPPAVAESPLGCHECDHTSESSCQMRGSVRSASLRLGFRQRSTDHAPGAIGR